MRFNPLFLAALLLAGCGGSAPPEEEPSRVEERPRETVFDPMTSTIGRAQGVQQTVDAQAAELRKKLEAAER